MSETAVRPRYYWGLVGFVILVSAALRFYDLGGPGLWIDEIFTALYARLPVSEMFKYIRDDCSLLPFYFLSLHAYPTETGFLLRSYSALLGVLTVLLLIVTVERNTQDWRLALLVGMLLAISPYHIGYSRTARMYALAGILVVMITHSFMRLLRGKNSRADWLIFVGLSMCAYTTHYFLAALPMAQYLTLGSQLGKQRSLFRKWVLAQFIAVIPLLVWFGYLAQNDTVSIPIGGLLDPAPFDIFLTFVNMFTGFSWEAMPWYAWPGLITALIGLIAGLIMALRQRKNDPFGWYWGCMMMGTLAICWFASKHLTPLYVDRYFIVFLPGMLILTVRGWQALAQKRSQFAYMALVGLIVMTGTARAVELLDNNAHYKEEWDTVAAYIEANAQPNDGIATANAVDVMAVQHYTTLPIPYSWLSKSHYAAVEPFPANVERVWLIVRIGGTSEHNTQWLQPDATAGFPIHDNLLVPFASERRDHIIEQHTFNGIALFLIDTTTVEEQLIQRVERRLAKQIGN